MADQITSDQISEARRASEEAARGASSFQSGQFTIGDQLKKTVQDLFNWNKDLLEPRSQAMEQFFSAPSAATEKYGKQFTPTGELNPNFALNPLTQNRLIQSSINTAFTPFQMLNELLGMRQGSISDIIGAGTGAFQAASTQAQNAATLARQMLQDLVGESQFNRQLSQQLQIAQMQAATSGKTAAQTEEKKQLIKEAAKLPADQRRNYILANGYNPDDPDFSGVVAPQTGLPTTSATALKETGQIGDFMVDPATGRLVQKPKTDTVGNIWNFITGQGRGEQNIPWVPFL